MEYIYESITVSPCLCCICNGIAESAMTDKVIEICRWDENTYILKAVFTNTLSGSDKTILDTIIDNSHSVASCSCVTDGNSYIDRGDPSSWDFTVSNFTTDGNWHELDLSSIVPEGTKAIHLLVGVRDDLIGSLVQFRRKGNLNEYNKLLIRTQTSTMTIYDDGIISCGADRIIEYQATDTTFNQIILEVRGWLIS